MSSPDSAEHPNPELPVAPSGLGHEFADLPLLHVALTHRSWCAEHTGASNERLEFLGDAVLGMLVAERTYVQRPDLPEGQLAKIRASVVSSPALAEAARALGLGASLRLGRGEVSDGGEDKDKGDKEGEGDETEPPRGTMSGFPLASRAWARHWSARSSASSRLASSRGSTPPTHAR